MSVGQVRALAAREAPDGRGVPSLGSGQDDRVVLKLAGLSEEDRRSQGCSPRVPASRSPAVKGVPEPGKKTLLTRCEPPCRGLLTAQLGQLAHQVLLLG